MNIMKTLKLFNAVVAQPSNGNVFVSEKGYVIEPSALWAKRQIVQFYKHEQLDGFGLNKTFHKSWGTKLSFKVIKAYSKEEMTEKCLRLLQSGIALKEETIDEILSILVDELSYTFTGDEPIKNKEAMVKIADMYGILPKDTLSFFRYIIYRATGDTLLIKSDEVLEAIKASRYNPAVSFEQFGLERLATIFNRFKPLFLAFKPKCAKTINRISKLSKIHHQPLASNPLNMVTSLYLSEKDKHWLDNATPFALFKALSACYTRMGGQYAFAYRIRNGKSFVRNKQVSGVVWPNYYFLHDYMTKRFDLSGKKFYIPKDVEYALPTSEKMYVGNIPTGTKFFGKALAVGVYWENHWGATDLDLSGLNIGGKIGWNAKYKQGDGDLMYSGDITDAASGAVEYLHARNGLKAPTLVKNNVYSGNGHCGYKIIVGRGSDINHDFMMDPNKLFVETKCQSVQKQTILGMLMPTKTQQCFVLLNFGAGESRVSGNSEIATLATKALYQQWRDPLSFRDVLTSLGAEVVANKYHADYDFSLDQLQKDSFVKVFTEN